MPAVDGPTFIPTLPDVHPDASIVTKYRLAVLSFLIAAGAADAHDPSAYGGLFRSSDGGTTWLPADGGLFVGGAMAFAYRPGEPTSVLYGTDNRLMASSNGGRDWSEAAKGMTNGPVFAVGYTRDGRQALASTARGLLRWTAGTGWTTAWAPAPALPAHAILPGAAGAESLLLAGPGGLYASTDGGRNWAEAGSGLPRGAVRSIAAGARHLFALATGNVYRSRDGGATFEVCAKTEPIGSVEAIDVTPGLDETVLAAGANRVVSSPDGCARWRETVGPLPAPTARIHRILSLPSGGLLAATSRGLLVSSGPTGAWALQEGNLPVHLEAGLLVRSPVADGPILAGFALTPYDEIRRRAEQGGSVLAQTDPISLAGAAAFLILLCVAGASAAMTLAKRARRAAGTPPQ